MLVIILVILGINQHVINQSKPYIISIDDLQGKDIEAIVVLGCLAYSDGTPSIMLKDRLDTTIDLYENKVSDTILVSGDHQGEYDEINPMCNYLLENNVDEDDIECDPLGLCTLDSMKRASNEFNYDKIVVVTQKYHLYRAIYDARKQGIEVYGVACKNETYRGQSLREIREILARIKDVIYCNIG